MAITPYQSNRVLNNLFGATSFSPEGTLYIGLSTTALNQNGGGYTEPTGAGYARVTVQNNKTNWGQASNSAVTNATAITFPESTSSWGTITHVFISDAPTGGNVLYWDALTQPRAVAPLTTLMFSANTLKVTLT